ncbi:hypothetical protein [Paenibacillus sp. SYP-B3998]|uniref:hypothetical protein n=1 Tax=Paenibacillus sp. SYP-B3998 TaxID=2678564 RepID=UPI001F073EDF|nr:hypothetical protein [Paenibacillus sp. SYP-B3998]
MGGKLKYICPICGFDEFKNAPYDENGNESFEVCHCCGFEFGFDDVHEGHTFESYRAKWIGEGALWFYQPTKPINWDLNLQLGNIEKIQPMYLPCYLRNRNQ